jgi:hypothetical protein
MYMENQKKPTPPWDEIIERLYRRQEPNDILMDLISRKKLDESDISLVTSLISEMKVKIESFRLHK